MLDEAELARLKGLCEQLKGERPAFAPESGMVWSAAAEQAIRSFAGLVEEVKSLRGLVEKGKYFYLEPEVWMEEDTRGAWSVTRSVLACGYEYLTHAGTWLNGAVPAEGDGPIEFGSVWEALAAWERAKGEGQDE
jgi:hypothetical protein